MIKGKIKDEFEVEYTFELVPDEYLIIKSEYWDMNRKFNASEITDVLQVLYLFDYEIADVREYQVGEGPWKEYRQ
jgi:hypothetical protein